MYSKNMYYFPPVKGLPSKPYRRWTDALALKGQLSTIKIPDCKYPGDCDTPAEDSLPIRSRGMNVKPAGMRGSEECILDSIGTVDGAIVV
jgi:hypothetical protein